MSLAGMNELALGIDLGTSGIRSAVIDKGGEVIATARGGYGPQNPDKIDAQIWWAGVQNCLVMQMTSLRAAGHNPTEIVRIGVDGTSGSMVLMDSALTPVTRALMYNSSGFEKEAAQIAGHAPEPHIARGAGSALARMLRLQSEDTDRHAVHLAHQADFILAKLMGLGGISDHNNALKTGYDPEKERWPEWAKAAGVRVDLFPQVHAAGAPLFVVCDEVAEQFGLLPTAVVHSGTTDSVAAFLAGAPLEEGAAVTSLGTTLAIKLLSPVRIDAPEVGLYSHYVGGHWLVGGASNTGGGVLKNYFSDSDLIKLSSQIDPEQPSGLDYYPLSRPGERFPINDPTFRPILLPRPTSDVEFLHGLFEGMARIEARCYAEMAKRGASMPTVILTAGGGAKNRVWSTIRQRVLGVEVRAAPNSEAAVGVGKLLSTI